MSRPFPLSRGGSQRLEVKGADALEDPEQIARDVVAMLNADGGEVWVGLRDDHGIAVAVEPLANPELEQRRLHDYLVDIIEPPLTEPEAKVVIERNDEGEAVLVVDLSPLDRNKPYAFLRKGGRHFLVRMGDRVRPMTREEILRPASPGDPIQAGIERALSARQKAQSERGARLWLLVQPLGELALTPQKYEALLYQPESIGIRPGFWIFGHSQRRAEWTQEWLRTNPEEPFKVELAHSGRLVFSAPLGALCPQRLWPNDLLPQALVESLASALRMACAVYRGEGLSHEAPLVIDLALFELRDHFLNPRIPEDWSRSRAWKFQEDDFLLVRPLVLPAGELLTQPDRVTWRLVERIYSDFGLGREDMPDFFEERTGSLRTIG